MRVVAGSARGRKLVTPTGATIRPTADRVREAMFNALGSLGAIEGSSVLDLFAGTGALGIEALSRGARAAVFVDQSAPARRIVAENLERTGFLDSGRVLGVDAWSYLRSVGGPDGIIEAFDLVLLDPPYSFDRWTELLVEVGSLVDDGLVVTETDRQIEVPPRWRVERAKRYGGTLVTIARPPSPPPEPL